jgi:DNA repair photolyase
VFARLPFCYARRTHWFLDEDGIDGWSTKLFVKVNAPDVLRRELARPSWRRDQVAVGTATDPYQAIEGRYRVTRRILEALCEFRTPAGIVTRSPLIRRDLDVLQHLAGGAGVTVCVSIVTTDASLARRIEPRVAPPGQRLRTIRVLADAGIRCGVLLAPILPGLTDSQDSLRAVVDAAADHGAQFLGHNVLHLGAVTRDSFTRFLQGYRPNLLSQYAQMYGGKYAPAAYRAAVARLVDAEKARAGVAAARYARPANASRQLLLDL